jgi:hypothetical protein
MKGKNFRKPIFALFVVVLSLGGLLTMGASRLYKKTDHLWIRASEVTVTVNHQNRPAKVYRSSRGALLVRLERSESRLFLVKNNLRISHIDVSRPNWSDFYLTEKFVLCRNPDEGGKQLGPISSNYPPNYVETSRSIEFTSPQNERIKVVW